MNKQNKILLGILAFIVACTIGYALFNENITITGAASAKGDFSIVMECEAGIMSESGVTSSEVLQSFKNNYEDGIGSLESGFLDDSCLVNGNTVTMKTSLQYPSATRLFTVKVKNNGSVAAKFDIENIDGSGEEFVDGIPSSTSLSLTASYYFNQIDYLLSPDDMPNLNPGESAYIIFAQYWNSNDTNNTNKVQTYKTTNSLPFIQVTE